MLVVPTARNKVRSVNHEPRIDGRNVLVLPLSEVLGHPSLARAEPELLTGHGRTGRVVRWVHSSEVLDIAPLLRGGELLLTGGIVLAEADADRQRAYVRDLAAHGITAAAVEAVGAGLPEPLVDEARQRDFALIELKRTVPFVEIAEDINGLLVSDSVLRLRLADSISDALSAKLTSGADLQQLAETLASNTSAGVVVRDRSGDALAEATAPAAHDPADQPRQAPITVHGVTAAVLELLPSAAADPPLLEAALDRAPQAFGLALLRTRPPTPGARAARALFGTLQEPGADEADLAPLIDAAGLDSTAPFVAVVASRAEPSFYGALEQGLRRGGRQVLSQSAEDFLAITNLAPPREEPGRSTLVADVRRVSELAAEHPVVAVGPLAPDGSHLVRAVAEARRCLDIDLRHTAVRGVVDADGCSLHRLVHRIDDDDALRGFVREQLSPLLEQPPQQRRRLLSTLEVFFDCAANKSETAQRLHLRRQTLYQRLEHVSRLLGHEVTDPSSLADLQVAVRLLQVLDKRGAGFAR